MSEDEENLSGEDSEFSELSSELDTEPEDLDPEVHVYYPYLSTEWCLPG